MPTKRRRDTSPAAMRIPPVQEQQQERQEKKHQEKTILSPVRPSQARQRNPGLDRHDWGRKRQEERAGTAGPGGDEEEGVALLGLGLGCDGDVPYEPHLHLCG